MFDTNIIRTGKNREFHHSRSPKERSLLPEDAVELVKPIEEICAAGVWDEDRHYVDVYHLLLNAIAR